MGGKITSAFSPETRKLLKENQFFYDAVLKLGGETALRFKAGDAEAKTEVEMLKDGNVAIHVVIPIDANTEASDGRIYIRDTFIFDEKQKKLHKHDRSFEYNGRGENKAQWQNWLKQYKEKASAVDPTKMHAFASLAARSFSRPFSAKQFEVFKKLNNRKLVDEKTKAESDNPDYLGFYESLVGTAHGEGLTLRSRDPRSSYAVIHRGLVTEVIFTFALLDNDGKPGALYAKESFLLDVNTQALVGHKREVELAPDVAQDKDWQKKAAALNAAEVPDIDKARKFIGNFLPDILTDLPEFKDEAPAPPVGGYPQMDQAMFLKTLGAISRSQKAPALSEMKPEFFLELDKHKDYLAPLSEAMGQGFVLNLKDPPLKTSVQVVNGKTQVFATYSLKPSSGEAGILEYSERWTFDNGQLVALDRQAKALGAPSGGEVESATQRVKEAIQGGKFGDNTQVPVLQAIRAQVGFIAPHLTYFGQRSVLAGEQVSQVQQLVVPMIEEIQGRLVPILYQNDVDPAFRDDLLRLNAAFIHGDQQTLVSSLTDLQKREEAAIKSAADPEGKKRHQENLLIAELIFTLGTGDMAKAYESSKGLVSPAYKKVFDSVVGKPNRMVKLTEGYALMSKLVEEQIEVGEKNGKGWLSEGSKYTPAEKEVLSSIFNKVFFSIGGVKNNDPMALLQAAVDYGKDKKPEEMKEEERKILFTDAEKALAAKMLADPILKKAAHISQEEDRDLQSKELFEFARGTLFEKGLFQSSRFVVQGLVAPKMPKNGVTESIDILRAYAMEKGENAKVAKLEAMSPPPAEIESAKVFFEKLTEKAKENPATPIFTVLGQLTNLSENEQKLQARLLKSPTMKKINDAASLTSVEQRFNAYQQAIQPLMVDELLLDDVVARLEKNPKMSLKEALDIPDLNPAQRQLYTLLAQNNMVPEIEQKLAVAVSMPEKDRGEYYRKTLPQYLPNLIASQQAQQALSFLAEVKDDAAIQSFEGTALAEVVLGAEIDLELLPQTRLARGHIRAQEEEHKTIQSLLDKATLAAPMHPNASAYTALNELKDSDLNQAEKDMRKKLVEDKSLVAILEIGAEPDMVKRRQAYMSHLPDMNAEKPEPGTLGKAGYSQAEMWLAQQVHLGKIPDIHGYIEMPPLAPGAQPDSRHFAAASAMEHQEKMTRDVKKFLQMLDGKGDFGSKVGYGMPHFTKELTKPTSILAMAAAPLVGGSTQVLVFHRLRNLGMIGRGIAIGVGVGAEATTFTYLHAKGEKYAYGNDAPEKTFWNDLKTNALLFGAMRGTHLASAAIGENLIATGRLGRWGGARVVGEGIGSLQPLPTKQLAWIPTSGPGVPQLTVAGERFVGLMNHGGALVSMHGAGKLSHKLGWSAHDAGFDDTIMMYLQAMVGYGITNAATGGRLNQGVAELNMRFGNVKGANTLEGVSRQIAEIKAEKAKLETHKEGLNEAARTEVDSQINKLDGQILKLRKKADRFRTAEKAAKKDGKEGKDKKSDLIQLFEERPDQLILSEGESGPTLETRAIKTGEEIALDAHLLGNKGSDIVIKRDAEGKLTLHNKQKDKPEADGEPAVPAPVVKLNGNDLKAGNEAVPLVGGDVISVDGKTLRVDLETASPFHAAMAQVPRAQQLSLAHQISKAKKISDLFKTLRNSAHGGAGEVMVVVAEVLSGRRSVSSLPSELGLQAKVESLIEAQVKEWKKQGLEAEGYALKEGALPEQATTLETEYHTLRAVLSLRAGVEGSRTMYDLLQALGQSSLQTVGGVSNKTIFDSLGLESKRGLLEQITKAEAELREKIRLADRAIKREKKAWAKTDKEMVDIQEKNRNDAAEKADGLKALIELLKAEVEAADAAHTASGGRKLSELIQDLPRELGVRQKARDAVEQAEGEFAKTVSDKEKKEFVDLAKRYLGAGEIEFDQAQSLLRSVLDNGNWQGSLLLRRLKPEQLELAMKVYFGSHAERNLSPDLAFSLANNLAQAPLKENLGIVLSQSQGATRLDLIRGDLDAAAAKHGDVVIYRTHSAKSEAKGPKISQEEIGALVEQAKQDWKEADSATQSGGHYRSSGKSSLQLSDAQMFFDADTRSFQTWVSHGKALSKVRVTLDEHGEVESVQVKYAARPGQAKDLTVELPENLTQWQGKDGKPIPVEKQRVDFQALSKEMPFELKSPGVAYRALQKATWVGDKVPRVPKFWKFGDAAPEIKPDAKADKKETQPEAPKVDDAKPDDAKVDVDGAKAEDAKTDGAKVDTAAKPAKPKKQAKPAADPAKPDGSFFRGPLSWLGQRLPKFGSGKPKPQKVEAKPRKPAKTAPDTGSPDKVAPATVPPKAEGSRPTVPNDLQFPPSQIGSGETGAPLSSLEIRQSANGLMGEYAGRTHEGVGRNRNEDGIGMAYTNERDLVLTTVDGMGGHDKGKEAALITLETVNEAVQGNGDVPAALTQAHDKVVRDLHAGVDTRRAGASVASVKIRRPDSPDGPHSMEAYWAGDVSILVLRRGPDGKRQWIYQNAEDNLARLYTDTALANGNTPPTMQSGQVGRDLAIMSNPKANEVYNVIGSPEAFTPRRTREGLVPGPDGSLRPATGLDKIALQQGDVVLVVADGTRKNIKDPQVLIDLIEGQENAADISKTIDGWVNQRMKTVHKVDAAYESQAVPYEKRQEIFIDGESRFMDSRGNVYEKPEGGDVIDHYEADNFSVMAYVHNPEAGSQAPAPKEDSNPGFMPPSKTSLSDPDQTQIFVKPKDPEQK